MLRQLSAIFDTRALGYGSALVAAKVDPDRVDEAAAVISAHPGVSHNYKRNHAYNLWYTIAVPPGDALDEHVDVLHRESGALVTRKLPTLKLYKIGVKLDMTGKTAADARPRCSSTSGPSDASTWTRPSSRDSRSRDPHRAGRPPAGRAPVRRAGRADRLRRSDGARHPRVVQGAQAHAPLRRGDEPPLRRFQGQRDGRVGGARRAARGHRPADGRLRAREPLLPAPDLRRLALLGLHDGARKEREGLRSRPSRRSGTRPVSTSTRCCGRSRSTRRPACATSPTSGTSGAASTCRGGRGLIDVACVRAERPAVSTSSTSTTRARHSPRGSSSTPSSSTSSSRHASGDTRRPTQLQHPAAVYDSVAALVGAGPTDRARRERDPRVGHGLLRARDVVRTRATASSHRRRGVASNGSRSPDRATHRGAVEVSRRRARATLGRRAPGDHRRARATDRDLVDPDASGLVNPAAAVGAVARETGSPICSTRARPPASSRSMSAARLRLPLRGPGGGSICAFRGESGSRLRADTRGSNSWSRRSSTPRAPAGWRDDAVEIRGDVEGTEMSRTSSAWVRPSTTPCHRHRRDPRTCHVVGATRSVSGGASLIALPRSTT